MPQPQMNLDTERAVEARYQRDVAVLNRVAEWLGAADPINASVVALDYFRLADKLETMARDAREFARIYASEII